MGQPSFCGKKSQSIRQGDSFPLRFVIKDKNGEEITNDPTVVSDVDITVGDNTKLYSDGDVTYDTGGKCWLYPFSQVETFALNESLTPILIRVKFSNSEVASTTVPAIQVLTSISEEIL